MYDGSVQDGKLLETVSSVVSTGWHFEGVWTVSLGSTLPDGRPARVSVDFATYVDLAAYLGSDDNGPFTGGGLSGFQGDIEWANDIVHGIWINDPENVPQSWENIADSMTASMRVQSGDRVVGTARAIHPHKMGIHAASSCDGVASCTLCHPDELEESCV
jgi:hypothetical protein